MKRIAIILLIAMVPIMLCGCFDGKLDTQKIAESEIDNRMFMTVSDEIYGNVYVDKTTRVMYWVTDSGHAYGVMTMLVNPDGTPRIWEG